MRSSCQEVDYAVLYEWKLFPLLTNRYRVRNPNQYVLCWLRGSIVTGTLERRLHSDTRREANSNCYFLPGQFYINFPETVTHNDLRTAAINPVALGLST